MRSIMRSRSWGSLVPPTENGPAPWPRSTIDLYHDISTIDLMRSLCGADTCVVMLSVHREAAIRQDCLNAGAAAYMHKPLHLAQVSHAPRRS